MNRLRALTGTCAVLLSSCAVGDQAHFASQPELARSDYSTWMPFEFPASAKDIDVWRDTESRLVRASFSFTGPRPIGDWKPSRLSPDLNRIAQAPYPDIEGTAMRISFVCDKTFIDNGDSTSHHYYEVTFLGDTGDRIYVWNSIDKRVHEQLCGRT